MGSLAGRHDVGERSPSFSSLSAAERARALADAGTLRPWRQRLPRGLWLGSGTLAGRKVVFAMTDGHERGGTLGFEEGRALGRFVSEADAEAIVVGWDTGGVRVQEGPLALAATSAFGVKLTEFSLRRGPVLAVVSGPRGCFGAPAVLAGAADYVVLAGDAQWGLTGPKMLGGVNPEGAVSARARKRAALAEALVEDRAPSVRSALEELLGRSWSPPPPLAVLEKSSVTTERLLRRLRRSKGPRSTGSLEAGRERDLLRHSFRGQWEPSGPSVRRPEAHAVWGKLGGRPCLGLLIGPAKNREELGVEATWVATRMLRLAAREGDAGSERAPVVTSLFCRSHASTADEERAGLPVALGSVLRSYCALRVLGHPLLCILGGGVYGAAYLCFAAPSHRIVALRGTTVAPMAPRLLEAFEKLRRLGPRRRAETDLPGVRIVDHPVRLPRILAEELEAARRAAAAPATGNHRFGGEAG